nr:MAG TPA: hypothetical protein [Caudoviricetes sp.]
MRKTAEISQKIRGKHYLEKEVFGRSRRAAKGVRHPPPSPRGSIPRYPIYDLTQF